jgi:hypothetical protein
MTAEAVTAGGAFRLPKISGPVPVKSKMAEPVERSVRNNEMKYNPKLEQ